MKPRVVTTWDADPCENDDLASLAVEWIRIPLTRTEITGHSGLAKCLITETPGCLMLFSRAGFEGLRLSIKDDFETLKPWKIAVVGPQTAELVRQHIREPDLIGSGTGQDLCNQILEKAPQGPILLVMGDLGGQKVEETLQASLALWERFEAYRNIEPEMACEISKVDFNAVRGLCLASPSAVDRLWAHTDGIDLPPLLAIGPTTAARIRQLGGEVAFEGEGRGFGSFYEGIERFT